MKDLVLNAIDRGHVANVMPEARDPASFAGHEATLSFIEKTAREAAGQAIPALPWSRFRLFEDTGDRGAYEGPYFARRRALGAMEVAILAGRDSDGSLLTALHDLLWAMCDEYTWAVPAHRLHRPIPVTLDLFATETGMDIAELLSLLGDRIDRRVADRCHAEIRRRILDSFLGDYTVEWWESGQNNWGAVCACSIGIAFLYEELDPARRRAALSRVLDTMDRFLDSFPPDGACLEGQSYWEYGFGFFALFADFVHQFTGGAVDLFDDPRARRIARFPESVALSATRVASFADASRFATAGNAATVILRRHYGDIRTGPIDMTRFSTGCKPPILLRATLWDDQSPKSATLRDGTFLLPSAQWLVVRRAPFAFAALFGYNDTPHNHNDVGSFLLVDGDMEGPMDLGSGEYTRQYFSDERYTILCNGSQGHSVPIVGGNFQKAGREYAASDVAFEERDGKVFFSADIAGAYGLDGLVSLRRSFEVSPEEGMTVVTDKFDFAGEPMSVTERFVGYAEAEVTGPGEALFGAFRLCFDPSLHAEVHMEPMSPHHRDTESNRVFILDISLPACKKSFTAKWHRRN